MMRAYKKILFIAFLFLAMPWFSKAVEPVMIKAINPSPDGYPVQYLTAVNETLYFSADDGVNGIELWKSDGTATGTVLVKDINPSGDSNPTGLINYNNEVYFSADNGTNGIELWKSNGTASGTIMVKDIVVGSASANPVHFNIMNGLLYFFINSNNSLWKTDGTTAGTVLTDGLGSGASSKRILNGSNSDSPVFYVFKNELYFDAYNISPSVGGLYKTSGNASSTEMVKSINPFGSRSENVLGNFIEFKGNLYFQAYNKDIGSELWKTDGTTEGTVLVKDIELGIGSSGPINLYTDGNFLYFSVAMGDSSFWKSDGTESGTIKMKNVFSTYGVSTVGSGNSSFFYTNKTSQPVQVGNKVYFPADDRGNFNFELWVTDGTESGTSLYKDIIPGDFGSSPQYLTNINNVLYFSATDGVHGSELWKLEIDFTPPTIPNITSSTPTQNQTSLHWSISTDNLAMGYYNIYRNGLVIATTTELSYLDTGLALGTNYNYQVSAIDTSGNESPLSEAVSIIMPYPVAANIVNIPPPAPTISIPTPITITPTAGTEGALSVSGVSNAKYIAVSSRPDFSQSSWELYTDTYKLSDKTKGKVYVKFRSQEGGETAPMEVTIPTSDSINQPANTNQPVIASIKSIVTKPTPKPQAIKYVILTVNLAPGSKHKQVKLLQQVLVKQGLLKQQDVVGIYGPKTTTAVKAFQKKNNLLQTGTVGPLTRKVLIGIK